MKPGTRIKWSDATADSIPAYRDMRGVVLEPDAPGRGDTYFPLASRYGFPVRWDCDSTNSWVAAEWVVNAE